MFKLSKYLKKHFVVISVSIALIFIQVMSNLSLPNLMADIINKGILKNDIGKIWETGWIMLLVTGLSTTAIIWASFLVSRVSASFGVDVRKAIFSKITYASNEQLGNFGTASLVTRTTNDITQIQQLIVMSRLLVMAPLMGIGGVIMAISEAPSLSYLIFIVITILFAIIGLTLIFVLPLFKSLQKKLDKLNLVLREFLTGLRVIKAFNKSYDEKQRFDKSNEDLAKTTLKVTRIMVFLIPTMMFIMNASAILIIWIGGHQLEAGVEIGSIMAFMQYVMQILMSFLMLAMVFTFIPRSQVSAKRINEVLESKNTILNPKEIEIDKKSRKASLEFKNATFRFHNAPEPVLKNISFKAEAGQVTAIIGGTGSGKSTLIDLIPRFYDLEEGRIYIDEVEIKNYNLKELRSKIALVPQKPVIFSGTIKDNIIFGKEDATNEEIERAAKIAQAEEFIKTIEDGYDSKIAQGGTNLSGGQKQRLSIARAIVKSPEIFIFDDSFSALDFKTDAKLRMALKDNLKDKLIIIVAQRVSTIMDADQIIVLDEGEIVGLGTHKELYKNNPVYREIVLSQMEEGEAA